jgi:nitroimidazol reductase NimA-like FMN-containing flavoprotein (pyridoxamine 5'-phosphate oxidase superfamily)
MISYAEKAREIIEKNIYMTIATASSDGLPWISPVFFAYDAAYNLYWTSDRNSRHSTLIRGNPRIAIAIFDSSAVEGDGTGVYIEARAMELVEPKEIAQAISVLGSRIQDEEFKINGPEAVTGDVAWRIYMATPEEVSTLTEGVYINGQYVDRRISIDLP